MKGRRTWPSPLQEMAEQTTHTVNQCEQRLPTSQYVKESMTGHDRTDMNRQEQSVAGSGIEGHNVCVC